MRKLQYIDKKNESVIVINYDGNNWFEFCIPKKYRPIVININNTLPLVRSLSFVCSLLISIKKTGLTSVSLLSAIILELKPKVVLTYIDDNRFMGALQTIFPDVLIISVQNGTRSKYDLDFKVPKGYYNFPHYFGFGGYELSIMNKLGASVKQYYPFGSLKMGIFLSHYYKENSKSQDTKSICIISQYTSDVFDSTECMDVKDVYAHQQACMLLSKFSSESKVKIKVAMRHEKNSKSYENELSFYQEFFYKNDVTYCDRRRDDMSSYHAGMGSDLIIAFHSTLIHEFLGVGKKVLLYGNVDVQLRNNLGCDDLFSKMPNEILLESWDYEQFHQKVSLLLEINHKKYDLLVINAQKFNMNFNARYPHEVLYEMIEKRCNR